MIKLYGGVKMLKRQNKVSSSGRYFYGAFSFTIESWKCSLYIVDLYIGCRNSWIGLECLPLNLWSLKTFNSIGERCGGLLEVDRNTQN